MARWRRYDNHGGQNGSSEGSFYINLAELGMGFCLRNHSWHETLKPSGELPLVFDSRIIGTP